MTTLTEYLEMLVEHPKQRQAFYRNPAGAVAGADLLDGDQEVLASRDSQRIRQSLGDEGVYWVIIVPWL